MKAFKAIFLGIFLAGVYAALGCLAINLYMVKSTEPYIYRDIRELPGTTAVLVLGSQVWSPTTLSHVLEDRVKGGIAVIEAGKGKKLLLSGDHGASIYDEVNAMRLYVLKHSPSIPAQNIFMDHAGFNTYDSMYRARDVFQVDDVIIVTQDFHIARSVYIARRLGLNAVGYALPETRFGRRLKSRWYARETLARVKAWVSLVFHAKPKYLGAPVPITGDGRASWD